MTKEERQIQIALGTHPNYCKICHRFNLWFHEVPEGVCAECKLKLQQANIKK